MKIRTESVIKRNVLSTKRDCTGLSNRLIFGQGNTSVHFNKRQVNFPGPSVLLSAATLDFYYK